MKIQLLDKYEIGLVELINSKHQNKLIVVLGLSRLFYLEG